jgi:hypothetical protein
MKSDFKLLSKIYSQIYVENNITESVMISNITIQDKPACYDVFEDAFPDYSLDDLQDFLEDSVSWQDSYKATIDGNIVGIYFIG